MAARRRPPKPVIGLVLVLLVATGVWWWWSSRSDGEADRRLAGSIEATQYQVAPVLAGKVVKVLVQEGETVSAGQAVAQLDPAPATIAVQQASAGVDAATAAVRQARDDGTTAEVAEAQARLRQAQSAVALAKVQLGYATITAPHAGTVATVTTNVGQAAAPGRTLLTISDTADLWARIYVPEPRMGEVRIGGTARVSADGIAAADGTVTYVADHPEFTPNNVETQDQRTKLVYQARVTLKDSGGGAYKPGQPVDVILVEPAPAGATTPTPAPSTPPTPATPTSASPTSSAPTAS